MTTEGIKEDQQLAAGIGESFCVALEREDEQDYSTESTIERPQKLVEGGSGRPRSKEGEHKRRELKARLKKFTAAYEKYREFQPKPGKETKVSGDRQVATSLLPQRRAVPGEYITTLKNVWNPYILSKLESKDTPYIVVREYLKAMKELWPSTICRFNEEVALRYLQECGYFPHIALKLATAAATDSKSDPQPNSTPAPGTAGHSGIPTVPTDAGPAVVAGSGSVSAAGPAPVSLLEIVCRGKTFRYSS